LPIDTVAFCEDNLVYSTGNTLTLYNIHTKKVIKQRSDLFPAHFRIKGIKTNPLTVWTERHYCTLLTKQLEVYHQSAQMPDHIVTVGGENKVLLAHN
jgi:hypothetical protein